MERYADQQWALLVSSRLAGSPDFIRFTQEALASFAAGLIRRPTELILALDGQGQAVLKTADVSLKQAEVERLRQLRETGTEGWHTLSLGGVRRIAQVFLFEPFDWTVLVTERWDTFYQPVNRILWQSGLILLAAAVLSLALLLLSGGRLTRPLQSLVSAMGGIIDTGDLSRRVDPMYQDETGRLGHTFNLMASELERVHTRIKSYALQAALAQRRERRVRNIFQKYVPEPVINQLFQRPEPMPAGENRVLAVLFADIRNFSGIAETLRPDQVVESLNQYFGRMADIVMSRGGIVDKYIGDAIMAFFGAPVRHGDDARRAVLAGLEMIEALEELNEWQARRGRSPFHIGVGINYGEATVGSIGSEKKMDYTVIGDMVNLASRLEGLTRFYQEPILISESVYRSLEREFPCRLVDRVAVKGKKQVVRIYAPRRRLGPEEERAWKLYHHGLKLYYQREFEKAYRMFRSVRRLLPADAGTRRFMERTRVYLKSPPPADWTGAEVVQER
jgi:class 3 adenylate cyclase